MVVECTANAGKIDYDWQSLARSTVASKARGSAGPGRQQRAAARLCNRRRKRATIQHALNLRSRSEYGIAQALRQKFSGPVEVEIPAQFHRRRQGSHDADVGCWPG